jgi:DNA-binding transcriptional ArsR family regulator
MSTEDPQIWKALGSPHRRAILDALRDGAMTTRDLCDVLPGLSRFAVMQHLAVLAGAGVVIARRNGRERWNELNAVPIERELERWLNSFHRAAASQLLAFERHLDSSPTTNKED